MPAYQRLVAAVVLSLAVVSSTSRAAEGWQMPNLNPFAKKAGPPTSARVSDAGDGWKMPSFAPKAKKKSTMAGKRPQPTTWQKMTTGSKKFWSQTADTLNPFNDAKDNRPMPSVTGTNSYFSQASSRKSNTQKSNTFLPSFWSSEKESPKRSNDVNNFLSQPRPGY